MDRGDRSVSGSFRAGLHVRRLSGGHDVAQPSMVEVDHAEDVTADDRPRVEQPMAGSIRMLLWSVARPVGSPTG
jgi:hypothetical protein